MKYAADFRAIARDALRGRWLVAILTGLYTVLWTLLFIIPGIIKTYSYAMTPYILAEHP